MTQDTKDSKLKMHSPDLTQENIAKLAELFPNCVTESLDEKGQLKQAIDFDQLRQELSDHIVEGPQERYQLNWPGKKEALLAANAPIAKTLRPCREESVDFDKTKNLFIEGDNLDALKLLQETYLNKVKMIYIDPPYNTGRNLIYKNDYSEDVSGFLERTCQVDDTGNRLVTNTEANGRFHSDWLSMIYPRLRIAKNMLSEEGILVCAIDENELPTLCLVIKEIFGEGGYDYGYVSVVHNPRGQQGGNFSYVNEYLIFVYPSDNRKYLADFKKDAVDSRNLRDSGTESDRTDAKSCFYPFLVRDGKIIEIGDVPNEHFHPDSSNVKREDGSIEVWPVTDSGDEKKWRYARQSVDQIRSKLEAKMGRKSWQINYNKDMGTMRSVWANSRYDSSEYGSKLIDEMMPGSGFTYPKSLWAVYDSVYAATSADPDAIILDFFAGSGTTAHAVMQLNADDGGNRQFIMVQYPEQIDSTAHQGQKKNQIERAEKFLDSIGKPRNVSEIAKERIRRAGSELIKCNENNDVGFRSLRIDASNMKDVYYTPDQIAQKDLFGLVDNIKKDRTDEDLLFQVLLDWGVDLTLPIQAETISGKRVYFVDQDALAACFEPNLDEEFIKKLAERKPIRAVFRDSGFGSDSTKINVEQIFKLISPNTDVKTI